MIDDLVLPEHHPGFSDPSYRQRRAAISAASRDLPACAAPPHVDYTIVEHEIWATVMGALGPLHRRFAAEEYLAGVDALQLPETLVPQLSDVSAHLQALTGWSISAVPGLVPTSTFYGSLADRRFLSTQYVRHPSVPFYTPEPDIIHELIGHANGLANERMARMYAAAGEASRRATSDEALERFSRVFWFTMEFGVVQQGGELRTYGAGLLSSFGEIQQFRSADCRPFDIEVMQRFAYDITTFQDVLFVADSLDQVEHSLGEFYETL